MKKGFIYVLITAFLFATLEPVSKLAAEGINPLSMTFVRFFISSLILFPFAVAAVKKDNIKIEIKDHFQMAGLGALCICLSMVFLQYAVLKADSPALIAIIFSCNSVITVFLAAVFLNDKITPKKIAALILCLAGIVVCSWKNLNADNGVMSIILAFLSAFTFSVYTVLSKRMIKRIKGSIVTGYSFLYGSVILLIVLLLSGVKITVGTNVKDIGILLYLGIFVTGVGYWSYFKALEKSSATTASLAFFIKPVLAPFISLAVVGTPLSAEIFFAVVLVLLGSYLASYSD